MFVRKESNKFYYIYFININNNKRNKITTKAKTKKQALEFLNKFKNHYENNNNAITQNFTIAEFIKYYYDNLNDLHNYTFYNQVNVLNYFQNYFNKNQQIQDSNQDIDIYLNQIKQKHINNFFEYLIDLNMYSPSQIKTKMQSLIQAISYAKKNNFINLTNKLKAPYYKHTEPNINQLTKKEFQRLLNKCNECNESDLYDLLTFISKTDLTLKQLTLVRWNQFKYEFDKDKNVNITLTIDYNYEYENVITFLDYELKNIIMDRQMAYFEYEDSKESYLRLRGWASAFTLDNSQWTATTLNYKINKLCKKTLNKKRYLELLQDSKPLEKQKPAPSLSQLVNIMYKAIHSQCMLEKNEMKAKRKFNQLV